MITLHMVTVYTPLVPKASLNISKGLTYTTDTVLWHSPHFLLIYYLKWDTKKFSITFFYGQKHQAEHHHSSSHYSRNATLSHLEGYVNRLAFPAPDCIFIPGIQHLSGMPATVSHAPVSLLQERAAQAIITGNSL